MIVAANATPLQFQLIGALNWFVGRSVGRLVGWLVGWSVGRSVGRLVGWSVGGCD